jgi:hypothetical protein
MRFKLAEETPYDETLTAWAMLETMMDSAVEGKEPPAILALISGIHVIAREQDGYLTGRQMRTAVAFAIGAEEATQGTLTPAWIVADDAARARQVIADTRHANKAVLLATGFWPEDRDGERQTLTTPQG